MNMKKNIIVVAAAFLAATFAVNADTYKGENYQADIDSAGMLNIKAGDKLFFKENGVDMAFFCNDAAGKQKLGRVFQGMDYMNKADIKKNEDGSWIVTKKIVHKSDDLGGIDIVEQNFTITLKSDGIQVKRNIKLLTDLKYDRFPVSASGSNKAATLAGMSIKCDKDGDKKLATVPEIGKMDSLFGTQMQFKLGNGKILLATKDCAEIGFMDARSWGGDTVIYEIKPICALNSQAGIFPAGTKFSLEYNYSFPASK